MKKFICTADWHLKIHPGVAKEWQVSRYRLLFTTLIDLCHQQDAELIIAGDLFERAEPDPEELELALVCFRMFNEAGISTWLVSGNHETISAGVDTFKFLDTGIGKTVQVHYGKFLVHHLAEEGVSLHFVNHCDLPVTPKGSDEGIHLPFAYQEGYFRILISHFRCDVNFFIREEVNVERLLEPFDLCIAGDIHQELQVGEKLYYTNNPINKEFETDPQCSVLLLTVENKGARVERLALNLPALRKVICCANEPLPPLQARDFYRVEVTGSIPELRALDLAAPNVKLLKIPVTEALVTALPAEETEEIRNIPLEEELAAYMQVLGYDAETIGRMMHEFKVAA